MYPVRIGFLFCLHRPGHIKEHSMAFFRVFPVHTVCYVRIQVVLLQEGSDKLLAENPEKLFSFSVKSGGTLKDIWSPGPQGRSASISIRALTLRQIYSGSPSAFTTPLPTLITFHRPWKDILSFVFLLSIFLNRCCFFCYCLMS